jgi:hypothetical protein
MTRRRKKTKLGIWFGVATLLVLVGGFAVFVVWPRPPGNVSSIESWLNSNGYETFRPFRDNVPPGTVLRIERFGQSVAATADMVGLSAPQKANAADISWTIESDLESLGKSNILPAIMIGDLKEAGASGARVSINEITIREIPLLQLSDAAKSNPALVRLTNDRDKSLVLVGSVLEAGSIRCEFFTRDKAKLDLSKGNRGSAFNFGQDFRLTSEGTLSSNVPLLLGYHGYGLGTQALSLGEAPISAVRLTPLSIDDIARLRDAGARLGSKYQIFVLTIGLGNYSAALPGARDSATRVADRLLPFIRSQGGTLSSLVSSPGEGPRVGKDQILKTVNDFVRKSEQRVDATKPRMTIFYYFGHGVAEGLGRAAFMAPEDYALRPNERVLDSVERLVDVGEVLEALKPLSDRTIVLIDSCRKHEHEDEELIQAWKGLGQNESNMRDILGAIQFSSGNMGPSVVFFGSQDGTPAPVVRVPWSNNDVGPLAARLEGVLDTVAGAGASLTPAEFVDQMERSAPSDELYGSAIQVRGYTALREDFKTTLPREILFGTLSSR